MLPNLLLLSICNISSRIEKSCSWIHHFRDNILVFFPPSLRNTHKLPIYDRTHGLYLYSRGQNHKVTFWHYFCFLPNVINAVGRIIWNFKMSSSYTNSSALHLIFMPTIIIIVDVHSMCTDEWWTFYMV